MLDNNGLLAEYLRLLLEANEHTNLTNIREFDKAFLLHIEDSLTAIQDVDKAPEGRYGDLGSGGGFPGVPIAIETRRSTLLVDSVQKKMRIVESILQEMGLDTFISTYSGRIETLALDQPESFAVLTARALSSLNSLVELASPLLFKGGRLVCYKAALSKEEETQGIRVAQKMGLEYLYQRSFLLSDEETRRSIIVFEKARRPQIKLPRRIGLAQKKPYC